MRQRCIAVLLATVAACAPSPPASAPVEALLLGREAAHWLRLRGDSITIEQAPMRLAQVGARLVELFTVEEVRQHARASFLVASVYARDIVRGDSTLLFIDTVTALAARDYARAHPDDPAVDPEQDPEAESEPPEDGGLTVEASIALADQVGPWLGLEVHVDRTDGERFQHDTYWRTVDLRTARVAALTDLLGAGAAVAADSAAATARRMLQQARQVPHDARAARVLAQLAHGPRDFQLVPLADGAPGLRWLTHTWTDAEVHSIPLVAQPLRPAPAWWPDARRTLRGPVEATRDTLRIASHRLTVEYDTSDVGVVRFGRRAARVTGRIRHLLVLDSTAALPDGWRPALVRAFAEAGYYAPEVRATRGAPRRARPLVQLTRQ